MTKIEGPLYVTDMPLTADGNGPADESETFVTVYEVWDQTCKSLCRCSDRDDAELIVKLLNSLPAEE